MGRFMAGDVNYSRFKCQYFNWLLVDGELSGFSRPVDRCDNSLFSNPQNDETYCSNRYFPAGCDSIRFRRFRHDDDGAAPNFLGFQSRIRAT